MDLVTEKFKQKIAAVFYLRGRKFNQTRILSSLWKANSEGNYLNSEVLGKKGEREMYNVGIAKDSQATAG